MAGQRGVCDTDGYCYLQGKFLPLPPLPAQRLRPAWGGAGGSLASPDGSLAVALAVSQASIPLPHPAAQETAALRLISMPLSCVLHWAPWTRPLHCRTLSLYTPLMPWLPS